MPTVSSSESENEETVRIKPKQSTKEITKEKQEKSTENDKNKNKPKNQNKQVIRKQKVYIKNNVLVNKTKTSLIPMSSAVEQKVQKQGIKQAMGK